MLISNIICGATVTLLLLTCTMAHKTTRERTDKATMYADTTCKRPTYLPRPLAPDVRAFSPFYVVAITRTTKTEEIDNVCYTYFEDEEPFTNIISIVYRNGRSSHAVFNKHDIEGEPGIAQTIGNNGACLFLDYTLIPVCNQTVFPLYRCFLHDSCHVDIGPEGLFTEDARVVLSANPSISPDCAGDIARSLSDTSELSGRQFLFLPNLLPPQCITTYTTPRRITIQSIGADRSRATLLARN